MALGSKNGSSHPGHAGGHSPPSHVGGHRHGNSGGLCFFCCSIKQIIDRIKEIYNS